MIGSPFFLALLSDYAKKLEKLFDYSSSDNYKLNEVEYFSAAMLLG